MSAHRSPDDTHAVLANQPQRRGRTEALRARLHWLFRVRLVGRIPIATLYSVLLLVAVVAQEVTRNQFRDEGYYEARRAAQMETELARKRGSLEERTQRHLEDERFWRGEIDGGARLFADRAQVLAWVDSNLADWPVVSRDVPPPAAFDFYQTMTVTMQLAEAPQSLSADVQKIGANCEFCQLRIERLTAKETIVSILFYLREEDSE